MKAYSSLFDELTVAEGLVLRGERIVVPRELREAMVKIAHEGHQGIVRTKQLLRAHVWFPGIVWQGMIACQAIIPCHTRDPHQMSDLPTGPWKKISVDFAGPFPNKDMALVLWDQYSRSPVVEFVTSTSAEALIPQLTRVFTTYGIPEEVTTDNER